MLPDLLVERTAARQTVLFVGAGMSQAAGLPRWRGLLRQLLERGRRERVRLRDEHEIGKLIAKPEPSAIDLLGAASLLQKGLQVKLFHLFLREILAGSGTRPTLAHTLAHEVGFAGILTTKL
jgi:hypothetical protein